MRHFGRKVGNFIGEDGLTIDKNAPIEGGAKLTIQGGDIAKDQIKLLFGQGPARIGWWMEEKSIADLVAQLLYIREDLIQHRLNVGWVRHEIVEDDDPDPDF